MDIDEFVAEYPVLFHATSAGGWESMRQHGLQTTEYIVTTGGLAADTRRRLLLERRPRSYSFDHPSLGHVTIEDHKPLQPKNLTLPHNFTVEQWFAVLNNRVFFWVPVARLKRFLKSYSQQEHDVVTIDARSLIRANNLNVRVTRMNSGATRGPNAPERGEHTFYRLEDYPAAEHRAIVELTVIGGVEDLRSHVLKVERYRGPTLLKEIALDD